MYFGEGLLTAGVSQSESVCANYPNLLPIVLFVSSSTLVVKEDGVEGAPSLLGGCVTPTAEKGENFRSNGLIQS